MADNHKSVTVVSKAPAKYRVAKYNAKGEIVEERWAPTNFRAEQEAQALGGKIVHE